MQQPILITGCPRSGTSMVAGAINFCGAFGGEMSGPNQNNKKGMFENAKIRNAIVKPYLRKLGVDPLGQYPLPDVDKLIPYPKLKERVEEVIMEQGYESGPWMYKGAKMALVWPLWHQAFPKAKWIIVRRSTPDIIRSCIRTNFMRAFSSPLNQKAVGASTEREGWLWWIHQHEERFREMLRSGLDVQVVWPERMVDGDYRQMMETIEHLGLTWDSKVIAFVDRKLWHSRMMKNPEELEHGILDLRKSGSR